MTVLATSSNRFSTVVKYELAPEVRYCRDVVVVNDAAQTYKVGTVLGKVTATGKYKLQDASSADGSETAAAVVIADAQGNSYDMAIPATTDTNVLALTRGPAVVSKDALVMGAGTDTTNEKNAVYASLKALGIIVETTI